MYKKYLITNSFVINHIDSGLWIPPDPANTDYQVYLLWLAEGNEPEIIN